RQLGVHPVEVHRLELKHDDRAGGVLRQGLVDPDPNLGAGGHLPVDDVFGDELLRNVSSHGPRGILALPRLMTSTADRFAGTRQTGMDAAAMHPAERLVRWVDAFQQRHRLPGFVFGVVKKFGDDRAGSLAALLAYYGFLAVFPLLLLAVTVLGFVAQHNRDFQQRLVDSALAEFPVIGDQIGRDVTSPRGNGLGLVISLIGLAWGALGFTQAGQHAMAQVWNVPGVDRPGFFPRLARGVSIIGVLGLGTVATSTFSGFGVFNSTSLALRGLTLVMATVLNV